MRDFHACKHEEGQFVSTYVLKMKSYIDNLKRLGHPMSQKLRVNLILTSPSKEYETFVQNFNMNMHCTGKTIHEFHAMLILHEQLLPKKDATTVVMYVKAGRIQKKKNKNNKKPQKAAKSKNQRNGKA